MTSYFLAQTLNRNKLGPIYCADYLSRCLKKNKKKLIVEIPSLHFQKQRLYPEKSNSMQISTAVMW